MPGGWQEGASSKGFGQAQCRVRRRSRWTLPAATIEPFFLARAPYDGVMTWLALLALAAAGGAQAGAQATARIVRGERISLAQPVASPDRQLRDVHRRDRPEEPAAIVRLTEFQ